MSHYTQEEEPPGWEDFARENAVVLLRERDARIERLRQQIKLLMKQNKGLRRELSQRSAEPG